MIALAMMSIIAHTMAEKLSDNISYDNKIEHGTSENLHDDISYD